MQRPTKAVHPVHDKVEIIKLYYHLEVYLITSNYKSWVSYGPILAHMVPYRDIQHYGQLITELNSEMVLITELNSILELAIQF